MKENQKKKRKKEQIIQLITIFISVILLIYISKFYFLRFDLTSEKRYTLTETTKKLLASTDDALYLKIYLAGDDMPIGFKKLQQSCRELLDEFRIYAGKRLDYEFINPFENIKNNKDIRQIYAGLKKKGLQPTELKQKSKEGKISQKVIFPGAILNYKGREIPINLLKNRQGIAADVNFNNSVQSLEYEFTNAIRKISIDKPMKIGFVQGHGELPEIFVRDIAFALSEYYIVEKLYIGGEVDSLSKYSLLIFAKPTKKFKEKDKFAIDQYLMQGGSMLWLADGVKSEMDSIKNGEMIAYMNDINMTDQFFRYGMRLNPDIIQDMTCASIGINVAMPGERARIKSFPWLYFPLLLSNNKHPINKYLNLIHTQFISSIDTVGEDNNIKKTILLETSNLSRKISVNIPTPLKLDFSQPNQNLFNKSKIPVAVLVEGNFSSIYRNRNTNELVKQRGNKFREKGEQAKIILVADGDIIKNEVSSQGEVHPLGFSRHSRKYFQGNKEFIINAVNYLCDDLGLMTVRSREIKMRLLDKKRLASERVFWQFINTFVPIIIIMLFGLLFVFLRKRKYGTP